MPLRLRALQLSYIIPAIILLLTAPARSAEYKRTVERYTVPDVTLVNQDGKRVKLVQLVNSGKPVVVDFIYGTCTTICPVLSASYTNIQRKLGEGSKNVQLISISIDPENDTPAVMKDYLKRYHAKQGWEFFTGSREDIDLVMRAFDAYVSNKMYHYPMMIVKTRKADEWVRIYGLISTADFLREFEAAGLQ